MSELATEHVILLCTTAVIGLLMIWPHVWERVAQLSQRWGEAADQSSVMRALQEKQRTGDAGGAGAAELEQTPTRAGGASDARASPSNHQRRRGPIAPSSFSLDGARAEGAMMAPSSASAVGGRELDGGRQPTEREAGDPCLEDHVIMDDAGVDSYTYLSDVQPFLDRVLRSPADCSTLLQVKSRGGRGGGSSGVP